MIIGMRRIGLLVVVACLLAACSSGTHADSFAEKQAACNNILSDAKGALSQSLSDPTHAAGDFSTAATELRDAVSGLTASDKIRIDGNRLADLYAQTAQNVRTSGLSASTVAPGVNAQGAKIDADCHF
jgi:hypothetical protein